MSVCWINNCEWKTWVNRLFGNVILNKYFINLFLLYGFTIHFETVLDDVPINYDCHCLNGVVFSQLLIWNFWHTQLIPSLGRHWFPWKLILCFRNVNEWLFTYLTYCCHDVEFRFTRKTFLGKLHFSLDGGGLLDRY